MNGLKKNGERRKLGKNQTSLLNAMVSHDGIWIDDVRAQSWSWGPRSETIRLLKILVDRGCVLQGGSPKDRQGRRWTVTPEGHAALAGIKEAPEGENLGLIGRRITDQRPMTEEEATLEGWRFSGVHGAPTVLVLDDGTLIYPSQDHEGNGPGVLFGIQDGARVAFPCRYEEPE